jgi:hypothetical protein
MVLVLLERVVGGKRVRGDNEIGVLAAGNGDEDGGRQAACGTTAVDDLADSADVNAVVLEHLGGGFLELGGADSGEQLELDDIGGFARKRSAQTPGVLHPFRFDEHHGAELHPTSVVTSPPKRDLLWPLGVLRTVCFRQEGPSFQKLRSQLSDN